MFKKFVIFSCLISICQAFSIHAAESRSHSVSSSIHHSKQLTEIIATIQKLPEAKTLITSIQNEGRISILCCKDVSVCQEFGACWDPDRRVILVNMSPKTSRGELIGSILFELQNAAVNSKLLYYDDLASKGKIKKENYVRAIEFLEYQNSLKAHKLAEKGIKLGIFPANAKLGIYSNFEEHYQVQKESGHSAWIAYNYQQIAPKPYVYK